MPTPKATLRGIALRHTVVDRTKYENGALQTSGETRTNYSVTLDLEHEPEMIGRYQTPTILTELWIEWDGYQSGPIHSAATGWNTTKAGRGNQQRLIRSYELRGLPWVAELVERWAPVMPLDTDHEPQDGCLSCGHPYTAHLEDGCMRWVGVTMCRCAVPIRQAEAVR